MACANCDCAACKKDRKPEPPKPPKGRANGFDESPKGGGGKGKFATMIGYSDAPLPVSKP